MEFTTSLEQELRMLGVLPPAMEMKIDNEPDDKSSEERLLYLDKVGLVDSNFTPYINFCFHMKT